MTEASRTHETDAMVNASEIAKLASVGPSAVSNWRRRFADFPRPVGSTESGGDLFERADVDAWLRAHDRLSAAPSEREPAEYLTALDRTRGRVMLPVQKFVLLALVAALKKLWPESRRVALKDLPAQLRAFTVRVLQDSPEYEDLFDPLFELDPDVLYGVFRSGPDFPVELLIRFVPDDLSTPEPVAGLVVDIAHPYGTVFDPAVGAGEFLIQAAGSSEAPLVLIGQDVTADAWRLASARAIMLGIDADIRNADSMEDDRFPGLQADVVVCDPPWGRRARRERSVEPDQRWSVLGVSDRPSGRASDFAWLAHVISHLAPEGRGYVVLPAGTLTARGVSSKFRTELLRRGALEAIVALPGRIRGANAGAVLWVIRRPVPDPPPVLLIDATHEYDEITPECRERVDQAFRAYRAHPQSFPAVPGFAAAVAVLELIGGDAVLAPARWTHLVEGMGLEALLDSVIKSRAALQAVDGPKPAIPQVDLRTVEATPRLKVRDLLNRRQATLIRAARIGADDYTPSGLPVWLPSDIRPPWERPSGGRFVDPERVGPQFVTQEGDIVFTTVGELRTRVDAVGGHVLGASLQALRLEPGLFDPHAFAALLASEPNRRLATGVVSRVDVPELEVPLLPPVTSSEFSAALEALERQEEFGFDVARRASELRHALTAAMATGSVAVGHELGKEGKG